MITRFASILLISLLCFSVSCENTDSDTSDDIPDIELGYSIAVHAQSSCTFDYATVYIDTKKIGKVKPGGAISHVVERTGNHTVEILTTDGYRSASNVYIPSDADFFQTFDITIRCSD